MCVCVCARLCVCVCVLCSVYATLTVNISVVSYKGLLYFKFLIKCLATDFSVLGSIFSLLLVSVIHLFTGLIDFFPRVLFFMIASWF